MGSKSGSRAIVPFRHRHDGWTPDRQDRFLERLRGTGCVTEACRAVGLTTTSAYRAFHRMPGFASGWEQALAARRPMLEDAAFERAVRGSLQPLTRLGKVIGERRQYSDSLLRFLIEREDRREAGRLGMGRASGRVIDLTPEAAPVEVSREEANRMLEEKLDMLAQSTRAKQRGEAIDFADRMVREGKAP